ncbi:ABC transporter permease [Acidiferrimicrobium sp. IK]|uniref:ABC transporter permease n=1 Tax=Acidiferrimicrobium sp. IK TaxID=2871700 RepID=UPI0021CAEACB|nr:ABC transporter permease [Acidiferrimicrobium sp. IK]MCU4184289.1 ABC transporter permease [Acidiferrimicrobium sp. IK]
MAIETSHPPLLAPIGGEEAAPAGIGPYRLALRRLRRNKTAIAFGALFLIVVILCLLAPVYANDIAHTGPNTNHITEVIKVGGKSRDVVSPDGIPTGPTWGSKFFFGADPSGRDVAVRLLYGGRNSLEIGILATIITIVLATAAGVVAGYFRGWADGLISRTLDLIWAYPAVLLGVALGVNLALGGISVGPLHIKGNSNWIPALVIGVVYVPYIARPIRGQVLGLREREYIDAARTLGAGHLRIMASEILPNLSSTLVVFVALQMAQSIVLEASLSFLGAGVQPPNPSWGTMISEGVSLITAAPHLVLVPGIMLIVAVLSVNVFGEGLRAALDPRATIRANRT